MEAEANQLWNRIARFSFDEPGATLTFSARLARENGWRHGYAQRVIDEYRRFLFLSTVAGHPISPSEAIDQAWHLHLTYTKSYWERMCGEILPRPLHHCPTLGGESETEKFDDWYTKTIESYEHYFGSRPPEDIWPPPGKQFESAADSRWVNASEYFIIPRNPLKWLTFALLVGLPLITLGGCAAEAPGGFTPFDFNGPTFLKFIGLLFGCCLVLATGIRFLYPLHDPPIPPEVDTDSKKVYLAQGPKGLVLATLAKMLDQGVLDMRELPGGSPPNKQYLLSTVSPLPVDATPIEKKIYELAPDCKPEEIGKLVMKVVPLAQEEGAILQEMGLIEPNPCEPIVRRWLPPLIMLGIAGLGVAKICIGISRDKPVMYLVLITIASFIFMVLLFRRGFRTAKGNEIHDSLRQHHMGLNPSIKSSSKMSADEVFLAAGIFGATAFSIGMLGYLSDAVNRSRLNQRGWSSFGCSTGCGGSGCGTSCGGSSCGSSCGSGCGGD
ncbi:TIGR04222 domain-containing membrane protein [bacterium]|nr:TIGR04222 domain-containing membrane protein [bacterium]